MTARLIHYSNKPLSEVRSAKQDVALARPDKPQGLWFSVGDGEDGWRAWCEGESFNIGGLVCATEIVLHPNAGILRGSTAEQIDELTARYGYDCDHMPPHLSYGRGYGINWKKIAERHDGILIAPYVWERRLHRGTHWYYGWDCASGVIWNAQAVHELRALEPVAAAATA